MDRFLSVIKSLRTSPKAPGPWMLTRSEVGLLRAARRSGVTPRGLALFARSMQTGEGVKQREATIRRPEASFSVTGIANRGTLPGMDLYEKFGKASRLFPADTGLDEVRALARENRLALAAAGGGKAALHEALAQAEANRAGLAALGASKFSDGLFSEASR
jgi:hypothetical protein